LSKIAEVGQVIEFAEIEVIELALKIFLDNNISLPDSYLLAKAKQNKIKFCSFDAKANKVFQGL
jgi:predicted nucleic acid-binding protein